MRTRSEVVDQLRDIVATGLRAIDLDVPDPIRDCAGRAGQLAWVLGHGEEITDLSEDDLLIKLSEIYSVNLLKEGWR